MRSPVTVVDVHTAPEGSKPFHGVWLHSLEVEELAKRTLEVPPVAHLIHAFTEQRGVRLPHLEPDRGIAHLMPEAMEVTTAGSTRAMAVLSLAAIHASMYFSWLSTLPLRSAPRRTKRARRSGAAARPPDDFGKASPKPRSPTCAVSLSKAGEMRCMKRCSGSMVSAVATSSSRPGRPWPGRRQPGASGPCGLL